MKLYKWRTKRVTKWCKYFNYLEHVPICVREWSDRVNKGIIFEEGDNYGVGILCNLCSQYILTHVHITVYCH